MGRVLVVCLAMSRAIRCNGRARGGESCWVGSPSYAQTPARRHLILLSFAAPQPHASIDSNGAICMHDDGVEVELAELGNELDEGRDPDQDIDQCGAIRRRCTAEAIEQRLAAQLVEHRGSVEIADGGDAEGDVL